MRTHRQYTKVEEAAFALANAYSEAADAACEAKDIHTVHYCVEQSRKAVNLATTWAKINNLGI